VNIAVVTSGVSRRLGTVTGNSAGDFLIDWGAVVGRSIYLTATPIGGGGGAVTPSLAVGPGQMIDFRIATLFRQSTATVHDP
jgi:hypothetical protein